MSKLGIFGLRIVSMGLICRSRSMGGLTSCLEGVGRVRGLCFISIGMISISRGFCWAKVGNGWIGRSRRS
jgi:hypothetical protein